MIQFLLIYENKSLVVLLKRYSKKQEIIPETKQKLIINPKMYPHVSTVWLTRVMANTQILNSNTVYSNKAFIQLH